MQFPASNLPYDPVAVRQPLRFIEQSVIFTPIAAIINIARAVFNSIKSLFVEDKKKLELRDIA